MNTNYELYHFGILGMKWGIRRYQNPDGTLTEAGKKRYETDGNFARKYDYEQKLNSKSDSLKSKAYKHRINAAKYDKKSEEAADYSENKMYKYADKAYIERKKADKLLDESRYIRSDYVKNEVVASLINGLGSIPIVYLANRKLGGMDRGQAFVVSALMGSGIAGLTTAMATNSAANRHAETKRKYGM